MIELIKEAEEQKEGRKKGGKIEEGREGGWKGGKKGRRKEGEGKRRQAGSRKTERDTKETVPCKYFGT